MSRRHKDDEARPEGLASLRAFLSRLLPTPQFIRFLAVGVLNTLFGQTVFVVLVWIGINYLVALAFATVAGVLFNFQTFGRLVFGSHDPRLLWRFVLCYAAVYAINAAALTVLLAIGFGPIPAQLMLVVPVALFTFFANRNFVFRRKSFAEDRRTPAPRASVSNSDGSEVRRVVTSEPGS